jgi:hypothetical protein
VKSPEVRILSVHKNDDFNRDKGEVSVEIQNDPRAVKIMIRNLAAYSILKITIDFANVSRARLTKAVFRASNGVLPVEFDHRCYQAVG